MSDENANEVAQVVAEPDVSEQPSKKVRARKVTIGGVIVAAVILTISLLQFTTLRADDAPSAVDRYNEENKVESSLESDEPTNKVTPQYTVTEPDWTHYRPKQPSPVKSFKFESDYIRVKYKDGTVLLFTDASCGKDRVEEMKKLAKSGDELEDYIEENVKDLYSEKKTCE